MGVRTAATALLNCSRSRAHGIESCRRGEASWYYPLLGLRQLYSAPLGVRSLFRRGPLRPLSSDFCPPNFAAALVFIFPRAGLIPKVAFVTLSFSRALPTTDGRLGRSSPPLAGRGMSGAVGMTSSGECVGDFVPAITRVIRLSFACVRAVSRSFSRRRSWCVMCRAWCAAGVCTAGVHRTAPGGTSYSWI